MTRDEIMVCEASIDAMAEASDWYRRSVGLPGGSPDVPGVIAKLDDNTLALTRLVEAAQDEILKRAPEGDSPCAD